MASAFLHRHARAEIESRIEFHLAEATRGIERLDRLDGDPDLEETDAEDSFVLSRQALAFAEGAGCSIADPGGCEHDGREHEDGY